MWVSFTTQNFWSQLWPVGAYDNTKACHSTGGADTSNCRRSRHLLHRTTSYAISGETSAERWVPLRASGAATSENLRRRAKAAVAAIAAASSTGAVGPHDTVNTDDGLVTAKVQLCKRQGHQRGTTTVVSLGATGQGPAAIADGSNCQQRRCVLN